MKLTEMLTKRLQMIIMFVNNLSNKQNVHLVGNHQVTFYNPIVVTITK